VAKRLSEKLLSRIISNPNVKASEPAVRNAVSTIRRKNPGVTLNAAAFIYAERKGFKVWKQLDPEDRLSLQHRKDTGAQRQGVLRSRKPKQVTPTYGADFHADANTNANIYPYLYILENSLRSLILDVFKNESHWWNNPMFVKKEVQDYATRIEEAERKYPWVKKRAGHAIYYVGLSELYGIITRNWPRFQKIFLDQGNLRTWFNELVPVRNLVAHNVNTTATERKNVELRTSFICTAIENAKS
jgi:hypothetical protein